jgi:hypothetical protein
MRHKHKEVAAVANLYRSKDRGSNSKMTKDNASEQNNDCYTTKVQEAPWGDLFIELPQTLLDRLGWKAGDNVRWEETLISEEWGERPGLMLSNKSKLFRDATEARKKAVSIDME